MPKIEVKNTEHFESALRRFKRAIEHSGLLRTLAERQFYEKPTAKRKRKFAAATNRTQRQLVAQQLPKKLY